MLNQYLFWLPQTILIYRAHEASQHPLRSEIEEVLKESDCLKVYFLYSVQTKKNSGDCIKSVGVRLSPRRTENSFTEDTEDTEDKLCVNMAYSAYTLDKIIPNKMSNFYICGPPTFNSQTIAYLLELNVGVDNIFCESFGPMKV